MQRRRTAGPNGCLTRITAILIVGVAAATVALARPTAGYAEFDPDLRRSEPPGLFTEATITNIGAGLAVSGFDAPAGFDPLDGYPATIPEGSTADPVSFAGTLAVEDPYTGRSGLTYCIDLHTSTEIGVPYEIGDWSDANVANLGFVEYILQRYYPTTGEPSAAPTVGQRAAAVQTAIWFFSDNYVLAVGSPIRAFTEAIVADALANGPRPEPAEPQLSVTPDELAAPATGEIVGPFTVSGDGSATITSTGVEVFADPAGRNLIEDGDEVRPGSRLWARSASGSDPQGFVLERVATVLEGTVLLYDDSIPTLVDAQSLVLAQQTELVVRAGAVLRPFAAGGLAITKRIAGPGAGHQGEIVVEVSCEDPQGGLDQRRVVTLPARAPAGDHLRLVTGIPAASRCTLTEPSTGENDRVGLTGGVVIEPSAVTVPDGANSPVVVVNTYVGRPGPPLPDTGNRKPALLVGWGLSLLAAGFSIVIPLRSRARNSRPAGVQRRP